MTQLRTRLAMILLAVAVLPALPAFGQLGNTAEPSPDDVGKAWLHLLTNSQIQKELNLTDDQRVQILRLTMDIDQYHGKIKERITELLTTSQRRRFRELRLQVEGPAGLIAPDVVEALKLTPTQVAKLKAVQERLGKSVQQLADSAKAMSLAERKAHTPEILGKLDQLRKDTIRQTSEVLTTEQQEQFDKMQGVKMNLSSPTKPQGPPN